MNKINKIYSEQKWHAHYPLWASSLSEHGRKNCSVLKSHAIWKSFYFIFLKKKKSIKYIILFNHYKCSRKQAVLEINISFITMQQHLDIKFLKWKENLDWVQFPTVWFMKNQWQITYQNLARFQQSKYNTVTCLLAIWNNLHSGNCSLRFTTTGVKSDRDPIKRHRGGTTLTVIL